MDVISKSDMNFLNVLIDRDFNNLARLEYNYDMIYQ